MSYQHRQSPKQQLLEFGNVSVRVAVVTAISVAVMAGAFLPVLTSFGVFSVASVAGAVVVYLPHLVTAWMGLTLYLTSEKVGPDKDELEKAEEVAEEVAEEGADQTEDDLVENLKENYNLILKGYASMALLSLFILVPATISAYVTANFTPAFGLVIAAVLPAIEIELAQTRAWFLSPSTLVAFPSFVAVVPLTIATIVAAFTVGVVIALSQTLNQICQSLLKRTIKLFEVSSIDVQHFGPFEKTLNRRRRH